MKPIRVILFLLITLNISFSPHNKPVPDMAHVHNGKQEALILDVWFAHFHKSTKKYTTFENAYKKTRPLLPDLCDIFFKLKNR